MKQLGFFICRNKHWLFEGALKILIENDLKQCQQNQNMTLNVNYHEQLKSWPFKASSFFVVSLYKYILLLVYGLIIQIMHQSTNEQFFFFFYLQISCAYLFEIHILEFSICGKLNISQDRISSKTLYVPMSVILKKIIFKSKAINIPES